MNIMCNIFNDLNDSYTIRQTEPAWANAAPDQRHIYPSSRMHLSNMD